MRITTRIQNSSLTVLRGGVNSCFSEHAYFSRSKSLLLQKLFVLLLVFGGVSSSAQAQQFDLTISSTLGCGWSVDVYDIYGGLIGNYTSSATCLSGPLCHIVLKGPDCNNITMPSSGCTPSSIGWTNWPCLPSSACGITSQYKLTVNSGTGCSGGDEYVLELR